MTGSDTDIQWFIARDGKQHGPVSDIELRKLVELKHLKPADLVWRQGFSDWRSAVSVFPALSEQAPPPPSQPAAPPAATKPTPSTDRPAPAPSPQQAPPQGAPSNIGAAPSPGPSGSAQPGASFSKPGSPAANAGAGPGAYVPASLSANPGPAQPSSGASSFGALAAGPRPSSPQQPGGHGGFAPYGQSPAGGPRPGGDAPRPGPGAGPGELRADPLGTHPIGGAPHPGAGFPAPGPGQRIAPDNRKPADTSPRADDDEAPPRGRRKLVIAAVLLALAGGGAWLSSQYAEQIFAVVKSSEDGTKDEEPATANLAPQDTSTETAAPAASRSDPSTEEIDRTLQSRNVWVSVKQEFPDWYQARVAEVARLTAEQRSEADITRHLIGELVKLRRENAQHALAASTTRHRELAQAFLANLQTLARDGGDGCYEFISRGEASSIIIERMQDPAKSAPIDAQLVAIIAAIVEGRKQPSQHAAPVKTDYDLLAGELGRLGWTQADMQLFANPKELAQAPRERVCSMLQDWFSAHLAIQDPSSQERLLFETLKPVVSG